MTQHMSHEHCRMMLAYDIRRGVDTDIFADILKAGNVTGVILYTSAEDAASFQKEAERLVPLIQNAQVLAIIAGDSRIAVHVKADGIHLESSRQELYDTLKKYSPAMIVGYGNLHDRHSAMQAGEMQPDYLLFGKLGKDRKPAPHPRNLNLGEWWAAMIQIPCIVQAGSKLESIIPAASSGAEFVMLEEAVFAADDMPQALHQANRLLDEYTPTMGDDNR